VPRSEKQDSRCIYRLTVTAASLLFMPFFEFANPELDSARDFSRARTTREFQPLEFQLFRFLISTFDNSDPRIHDLSPAWREPA